LFLPLARRHYRYHQKFAGLAANSDRRYGDTDDLILTGFKQWDHGDRYAVQLIYAVECATESSLALTEGLRWGLGGAVRWRPDPELDIAARAGAAGPLRDGRAPGALCEGDLATRCLGRVRAPRDRVAERSLHPLVPHGGPGDDAEISRWPTRR